MRRINLVDTIVGRLLVVKYIGYINKKPVWLCVCSCGNEKEVEGQYLRNKEVQSCGCLLTENYLRMKATPRPWTMPPGQATINSLFANYRSRAKKIDREFSLSKEFFTRTIFSPCEYCGRSSTQEINYKRQPRRRLLYNGIDRKDPNLGYTEENCVSCCKICNYGKNDLLYADWLVYLDHLVKFRSKV